MWLYPTIPKVYSRSLDGCSLQPPKTAVRGISLVIPKGECFGLLGVNGKVERSSRVICKCVVAALH